MQYTIVHRDPQAFQKPVALDLIRAMCKRAFGQEALINSLRELDGGQFNNTYLNEPAHRDPQILRVAPPPERAVFWQVYGQPESGPGEMFRAQAYQGLNLGKMLSVARRDDNERAVYKAYHVLADVVNALQFARASLFSSR